MTFSYLSVCSGLGGARLALDPLGARCIGEAEIEAFPSAILSHRFGANILGEALARNAAPNFGDFTKINLEELEEPVDVLIGGTPCQAFSLAGLRGGLNDERGNLTLELLRLAQRANPEFIVWENVPGVISDETDALTKFLDGLEELGYVVDIDILDAQFFGVPQRRRRVFICAQRSDAILRQRTLTSALTIAQLLVECLHLTLGVLHTQSAIGFKFSGFKNHECAHSLQRRMKLFALDSEKTAPMLLGNLGALQLLSERGPSALVLGNGSENLKNSGDTKSQKSSEEMDRWREECRSTGMLWKGILEENLRTMRLCTTSTVGGATTESRIYTCAQMVLRISRLIIQSMDSSPTFWSAALSSSTALREFIGYARSANRDLFGDLGWVSAWHDFIEQAEHTDKSLSNFGVECFGEVLPVAQGLRGNSPPCREKGEGIAPPIAARTRGGGGLGTDFDCDGGLIASHDPAVTLTARDYKGPLPEDASEDGTGRGTPIVPICFDETQITSPKNRSNPQLGDPSHPLAKSARPPTIAFPSRMSSTQCASSEELSPSLQALNPTAVAFDLRGREGGAQFEGPHDTANIRAASGGSSRSYVAERWAVRRLTPRECERLQGIPDDHTKIPWRGKPADQCPDGPRYRAIGNGWANPVVSWIGRRLAATLDRARQSA